MPVVGEDDTYPKDRRGQPTQPVKFTIRAEKCPNRRGVEAVLEALPGRDRSFDSVLDAAGKGSIQALWIAAGYPQGGGYPLADSWITNEQSARLRKAGAAGRAGPVRHAAERLGRLRAAGAAWSEKEGTFVNHAGLAQPLARAGHAPGESRTEGQVYADLMGRRGLLHAATIRGEMAQEIGAFKVLATLPALGTRVELKTV